MRSKTFIAVAAFVALLLVGSVGVYAFDNARKDKIAEGVTVGGVHVGGLERAAAERRLNAELVEPLQQPVVIKAKGRRYHLTAERARVRADVRAMVDDALARSRRGNLISRAWREIRGAKVQADIPPEVDYDAGAVQAMVDRVKADVERPPQDAKLDFAGDGLEKVEGKDGFVLRRFELRGRLKKALRSPDAGKRVVVANANRVKPKVTTAELARKYPTVIAINRGGFRLSLYKRLKLVKTYPIAVGQVGLETPAGLYHVQNKAVNPAWNVPNSSWAGSLAGTVVPGGTPQNPLKARWMGIYNGAGIHGTSESGSIGTNASHGCIRMLIPDVIELYDKVPVGAPVYIV